MLIGKRQRKFWVKGEKITKIVCVNSLVELFLYATMSVRCTIDYRG
jgi:hypothetical protein